MTPSGEESPLQSRQLSFGFPQAPAVFGALVVTRANAAAFERIQSPESWPMPVLCVTGPAKCGLSSLASAWARMANVPLILGAAFNAKDVPDFADTGVAIDDADLSPDEESLLTLLNRLGRGPQRVLLTSHKPPQIWRARSPDLASRLRAMPVAEIDPPDSETLRMRLRAAGERKFMKIEDETLNFLVPRLELSYEAAETMVDAISAAVTQTGRGPTIPLVRDVLEALGTSGQTSG